MGEGDDRGSKDEEEGLDTTDSLDDDRDSLAHTFEHSKLEQLSGHRDGQYIRKRPAFGA